MISDHDRKLLAVLMDDRLNEPAQADLVRRLLTAHDAKDAVVTAYDRIEAHLDFGVDFEPGRCGIKDVTGINKAFAELRVAQQTLREAMKDAV